MGTEAEIVKSLSVARRREVEALLPVPTDPSEAPERDHGPRHDGHGAGFTARPSGRGPGAQAFAVSYLAQRNKTWRRGWRATAPLLAFDDHQEPALKAVAGRAGLAKTADPAKQDGLKFQAADPGQSILSLTEQPSNAIESLGSTTQGGGSVQDATGRRRPPDRTWCSPPSWVSSWAPSSAAPSPS